MKKSTKKKKPVLEPNDMNDILPGDMPLWAKLERGAQNIAGFYNFSQIETPLLERIDLFERAKIENNEREAPRHFAVKCGDKSDRVLRTDLRVPVMRSYLLNGFTKLPQPQRLFCLGPVFKEDPETARPVEFHELGFEIIGGSTDSIFDVQIINLSYKYLEDLRIKNLIIKINSSGCMVCRPNFRKRLANYFKSADICKDCVQKAKNDPIHTLKCQDETCVEAKLDAPNILDSLCNNCTKHFRGTLEFLEEIERPYMLDPSVIPSAEYYDKTIFEISAEEEEGESVVFASGGRYDYLSEAIAGPQTPAVGVTISLRRVFDHIKENSLLNIKLKNTVFLVYVGDLAKRKSLSLIEEFSRHNVPVVESLGRDSLMTQLEIATRAGSPLGLIFGQREAYEETVIVRDMKTGVQETIPLKKIVEEVKKRLKNA